MYYDPPQEESEMTATVLNPPTQETQLFGSWERSEAPDAAEPDCIHWLIPASSSDVEIDCHHWLDQPGTRSQS